MKIENEIFKRCTKSELVELCESNERERRDILILAIRELDKRNLSNTRFRHIVDCMLNHDYSYKSACKDADKVESSPNCWFREN